MLEAYRAMRQYSRAQEALAALAETVPDVSRYLLEPRFRDDPVPQQRLAEPPTPTMAFSIPPTKPANEAAFPFMCRPVTIPSNPRR